MRLILRPRLLPVVLGLAAACSYSALTSTPPPPPPSANDIDIVAGAQTRGSGAFDPNPKTLSLGSASSVNVRWVNNDVSSSYSGSSYVTHQVVSDDGTSFDTGSLGGNATSTKTLTAGTYAYHCAIHPSMVGTVIINR
jgi:plastocyanin